MSQYDDALKKRMEDNYKIREGERKFTMYFNPASQLPLWTAGKGEHGVDIIPYPAGKNDPKVVAGQMKEGDPTYCLDIYVHQNIGPRDEVFVCLDYNYKKPCPVCEYRNKLLKEQTDSDRAKEKLDKLTDALKPKRRTVYNVVVVTNREEEEKGIRVWEIAHYFMEKELQTLAGRGKARGKGYVFYAHPKEGKTVWFTRTGVGPTSTDYAGYAFEDRDYDIPQDWLDDAFVLDDHINIPTYEEVYEALWDKSGGKDGAPDDGEGGVRSRRRSQEGEGEGEGEGRGRDRGGDEGGDRERRPRRTRDAAPTEDEESQVRGPRHGRDEEGEGGSGDRERRPRRGGSDSEGDRGSRRRDEGEGERSRRDRGRDDDPPRGRDDEDPPRGRDRESGDGDRERRPRRGRDAEPEPEPEKPRRLGKAGTSKPKDGDDGEGGGDPASDRCPVPNGRFGVDTDKFEECDSCEFWESCVKAAERSKR